MPKPLVIVESPAKARTIARYLGDNFVVESSVGHIRDLPRGPAEIPAAYKAEPWARLGVDVDNGFKPLYVVMKEKKQVVTKLKQQLKDATELFLATDEDREGESIAWHLLEVLAPRPKVAVRRMVFHEITPAAIQRAVQNPRELDRRLVDAQEARRILDRLYGFEVSPVLWKKVAPRLSAGRVQSVATRIVVERERARMRFRPASYADLQGTFRKEGSQEQFAATLVSLDGRRLATGRDFDESATMRSADLVRLDLDQASALAERFAGASFAVRSVEEKPYRRTPYPPFMTSTLQQEAGRKLRFTAARTMQVAQRLYENGFITYMRTDSTALSEAAVIAARSQATQLYGPDYVPSQPRRYDKKVRNAQEAHEAIRPAGDHFRTPEQVSGELRGDESSLYELIWKRTVASQMADVRGRSLQVRLGAEVGGEDAEFSAGGKVIDFPGFLRAYVEGSDDPEAELEDREVRLPSLAVGDGVQVVVPPGLESRGHTTQPPARFTEASLVKALEELGVGRPSTYATILGTIQDRGYVWKRGTALVPTLVAFSVVSLLESHFAELVDFEFTARMEDELDHIAAGEEHLVPWLSRFYFGSNGSGSAGSAGTAAGAGADGSGGGGSGSGGSGGGGEGEGGEARDHTRPGLKSLVSDRLGDIDARALNSFRIGTDAEGREIMARVGRYGPFLQRGDDTAPLPDLIAPDELTVAKAEELLEVPSGDRVVGTDSSGLPVLARAGRYGPYVQLGEADPKSKSKPRTASLFKGMTVESVSLDEALQVLSLPRVVGVDPADGEEVTAQNGRYGPYVKKGTDSRSLAEEAQLFTVTLEEALALLAEPKRGRAGQAAAAAPGRVLGADPATDGEVSVRDGRFGPYVTDGTTNASLRKGDDPETITLERAAELLADRRERGPAPARSGGRSGPGRARSGARSGTASSRPSGRAAGATKRGGKRPSA